MVKLGLIQLEIIDGDWIKNREHALHAMRALVAQGARLLVLPEIWHSFQLSRREALADFSNETRVLFAQFARDHAVTLVSCQVERDGSNFYNTAFVWDESGREIAAYRKVHLFQVGGECAWFSAGDALPPVIHSSFGTWSVAICFDLRFPMMFRRLAEAGVHLVVVPAQWPSVRETHWRTLLAARAIENQMFMVGVNRRGAKQTQTGIEPYRGVSCVITPLGEPCLLLNESDEHGVVAIDLDDARRVREAFPCLSLSHPVIDYYSGNGCKG